MSGAFFYAVFHAVIQNFPESGFLVFDSENVISFQKNVLPDHFLIHRLRKKNRRQSGRLPGKV